MELFFGDITMIYYALQFMRVCGEINTVTALASLFVAALLFAHQSPTGLIKQRSFESHGHTTWFMAEEV